MALSLIGLCLKVLNLIANFDSVYIFCCGRGEEQTRKRANIYGRGTAGFGQQLGLSYFQRVSIGMGG